MAAQSESPSIYSRCFGDSPCSSFDALSFSNTCPTSEATQHNEDPYGSEDETGEPVYESPDTPLSLMGSTIQVYGHAPWELSHDNDLCKEDESYVETCSMCIICSHSKKSEDKDSSLLAKAHGFVTLLTNVAGHCLSSVPWLSTDMQGSSSVHELVWSTQILMYNL